MISGATVSRITTSAAGITWDAMLGALSYSLQIHKVGTTRWKTKTTTTTSAKLTNLLPGTSYEYQVATVCDGQISPYFDIQVFTTLQ